MKRCFSSLFALLGILLFFSCGNDPAKKKNFPFPDVETIAKKVDAGYTIISTNDYFYSLAKKPDGWFVTQLSTADQHLLREELFWSAKTGEYKVLPLDFWKHGDVNGNPESVLAQINSEQYFYNLCEFYGYDGWSNDVITALEGRKDLNDTLKEALGYAYGNKAQQIVRPRYDPKMNELHPPLNDAQTDSFCKWADKEIEIQKQIKAHDPYYRTLVGLIQTKLSCSYMFAWSELKRRGRPDDAKKYMVRDLFDKQVLSYAMNILNSVGRNAIIFGNGDVDTYSFWYEQERLGLWKDITVINSGMIQIPDWLFYSCKQNDLHLQLDESFYRSNMTDWTFINKRSAGAKSGKPFLSLSDINAIWKDESSEQDLPTYFNLPFGSIQLDDGSSASEYHTFLGKEYVSKGEFALIDLVATNYKTHPVFFQQTMDRSIYAAFEPGLVSKALVMKFDPAFKGGEKYGRTLYDIDELVNDLPLFEYATEDSVHLQVSDLYTLYYYNFYYAAEILRNKGDAADAQLLLQRCLHHLPFNEATEPDAFLFIGLSCYRCGLKSEGLQLLNAAPDYLRKWFANGKHKPDKNRKIDLLDFFIDECKKDGTLNLQADALTAIQKELSH